MSIRTLRVLAFGALLLAGPTACVDMEYGLALERDLSGTVALDFSVDFERMAYMSAKMQKMFTGSEEEPSEEEIEAARRELLVQMEEDDTLSEEGLREEIGDDLPEGVELLAVETDEDGLRRRVRVELGFDHVDRLNEMNVGPGERSGEEAGPEQGPSAEPFGDLEVVDEGATILVTNAPLNPLAEAREEVQGGLPGMEGMVAEAFQGLRVAFSIRAPFEVAFHNATRVDGDTLWWEYDFAALAAGRALDPITVRFRK